MQSPSTRKQYGSECVCVAFVRVCVASLDEIEYVQMISRTKVINAVMTRGGAGVVGETGAPVLSQAVINGISKAPCPCVCVYVWVCVCVCVFVHGPKA